MAMARSSGGKVTKTDRLVMVSARVPSELAKEIKLYAVERGISLQELIREALQRRVVARPAKAHLSK